MGHSNEQESNENKSLANQMLDETITGGAMFYIVAILLVMALLMFGIIY